HYGNTCTVQSNTRAYWSIIEMAVRTVENTGSQYHVLLIIADVQVSHFVAVLQNLNPSHLLFGMSISLCIDIVAKKGKYEELILTDGAWDMMCEFDGNIPLKLLIIFRLPGYLYPWLPISSWEIDLISSTHNVLRIHK
ncbi:hypothetical protein MKW92_016478, partial [Papaver armeniacum]